HELADLTRREIDDGRDLPADERARLIVLRDLRARFPGADALPEIDDQLQRGLARLRKRLDRDDGADANVDGEELVEGDLCRRRRGRIVRDMHGNSSRASSRGFMRRASWIAGYQASRAR